MAFLLPALTCSAQFAPQFELLALQGQQAPSLGPTAEFGILGNFPHIDASGQVSVGGFVGFDGGYAVWTGVPGTVTDLVVTGDPTPGRPGETLDPFSLSSGADYWPCPDGSVAFRCRTVPSNDTGVWQGRPGSLEAVVIVGDPAPGIPGATIRGTSPKLVANGDGTVLFSSRLNGVASDVDSAIWLKVPGQATTLLAQEGSQAPGTSLGTTYDNLHTADITLNANGQLAFAVGVRSGDFANNNALFAGTAGALLPVLRKGDAIPGMPGFTWDSLAKARINRFGDIAFQADPKPGGPKSYFVRIADGSVVRIASVGEAAPGAGGGLWTGFFFNQPLIAGTFTAFMAGLDENTFNGRDGIWLHERGVGTSLVVKLGDAVPGSPGDTFSDLGSPLVNALGSVVFLASTAQGERGIWHYRDGALNLVIANDQFIRAGPGGAVEISSLNLRNERSSQSGFRTPLNDQGHLAFKATLSMPPGTAVFRTDLGDFDFGGTGYLLEEAFGGDQNDASDDHGILPTVRRDGNALVLTYRKRTDGAYLYEVQGSPDNTPGSWGPATGTSAPAADQSGLPAGFERIEFRLPVVNGEEAYLRLQVTAA